MQNILILCTGNSCRSQIAEGFLKKLSPPQPSLREGVANAQAGNSAKKTFEVYSAGIEAHGLNPRAVKAMNEIGIDISSQRSKTLDEFLDTEIDFVITVCDSAKESCPVFPNAKKRMHHSFHDPANATGTEEEIMSQFRKVRDEIGSFCKEFIQKNIG